MPLLDHLSPFCKKTGPPQDRIIWYDYTFATIGGYVNLAKTLAITVNDNTTMHRLLASPISKHALAF